MEKRDIQKLDLKRPKLQRGSYRECIKYQMHEEGVRQVGWRRLREGERSKRGRKRKRERQRNRYKRRWCWYKVVRWDSLQPPEPRKKIPRLYRVFQPNRPTREIFGVISIYFLFNFFLILVTGLDCSKNDWWRNDFSFSFFFLLFSTFFSAPCFFEKNRIWILCIYYDQVPFLDCRKIQHEIFHISSLSSNLMR